MAVIKFLQISLNSESITSIIYIYNLDIQETIINFKNKNPIANKSIVKPNLTNNLKVDKQINKVKN